MVTGPKNEKTGVSLQSFLQIIELDKVTATVSIKDGVQVKGSLFFVDGALIDAEYENKYGLDAAYILCIQKYVSFSIDPPIERPVRIDVPLSHILLKASVLHDEQQKTQKERNKEPHLKPVSLQELVYFFDKSEKVIHYILLDRQGKIIIQSGYRGKKNTKSIDSADGERFTPFLMRCASSMVKVTEQGGSSAKRCIVVLEDGKVSISDWYKNIVLSVLLTNIDDIEKMKKLLNRLQG